MLVLRSVRLLLRMTREKVSGLPRFARNDRFEVSGLPCFARNDGGRGLVVVSTYLSIHLFFDVFLLEDLLFFYFFVKLS